MTVRLALIVLSLAACSAGTPSSLWLPTPQSTSPIGRGELLAGFAKVDITPPPGMGLSGNGFEGQQASGYSQRLYARAMVMEDSLGERIAFVVADVPHVSSLLHRLTAEQTSRGSSKLGADRLVLSATHTHSSVANHYTNSAYNEQSGRFSGYDAFWVEFLVERLVRAVDLAYADLMPALARWSYSEVPGVTSNRSPIPFAANPVPFGGPVDDTLYTLRVDQCEVAFSNCVARGGFGVFAIHGTGYPATGDLLDPDIPGVVQRHVERAIDRLNGALLADTIFRPEGVYVLANGTEGDVSPDHDLGTRCENHLRQRPGPRPRGPNWAPPAPEVWRARSSDLHACMERARTSVARIGNELGSAAERSYNLVPAASSFRIRRAFTTIHLPTFNASPPLCPNARFGTSNVGGAPNDARTRLLGWSFLWVFPSGFEPGSLAVADPPHGCQGEKRVGLGFVGQGLATGPHGLPEYAQFSVVQMGRTAVVSLPWEVTTVAGRLIKNAVQAQAPWADRVVVVGLANGYFQYLTTREEYSLQHYEGGSNLYGRNTLDLVIRVLEDLTRNIGNDSKVGPIEAFPGAYRTYFKRPSTPTAITRVFTKVQCDDHLLVAEWEDVPPGQFQPADGQVLRIADGTTLLAWDDHPNVEVRAIRSAGGGRHVWRVTYRSPTQLSNTTSVQLLSRPGVGNALSRGCF